MLKYSSVGIPQTPSDYAKKLPSNSSVTGSNEHLKGGLPQIPLK